MSKQPTPKNDFSSILDKLSLLDCTRIVYVCQIAGLLSLWIYGFAIFPILGLVLSLLKYKAAKDNPLFTAHFKWQIMTAFVWFVAQIVGKMLLLLFIGYFVMIGADIWMIYRAVRGFLALIDDANPSNYRLSTLKAQKSESKD